MNIVGKMILLLKREHVGIEVINLYALALHHPNCCGVVADNVGIGVAGLVANDWRRGSEDGFRPMRSNRIDNDLQINQVIGKVDFGRFISDSTVIAADVVKTCIEMNCRVMAFIEPLIDAGSRALTVSGIFFVAYIPVVKLIASAIVSGIRIFGRNELHIVKFNAIAHDENGAFRSPAPGQKKHSDKNQSTHTHNPITRLLGRKSDPSYKVQT